MVLKDKEADGLIKWVDEAMEASNRDRTELGAVVDSSRRTRVGLNNTISPTPHDVVSFAPVREGTVRLVPKDWGLGDSDRSELWKFAFTSKQVMQAQPLGMVHDMHPIAVAEPTSFGHEFGSLALGDFINPFQDLISWLVNSRMENVRTTVNNQYIVDPNRIELQDLRAPAAGKVIRLKQSAIGTPVDQAIRQLDVRDVTQGHIGDIQMLRMLADASTGVNDNMRGIQSQGGRRSATEARMSMQAGASRLSQFGVRISGQSMGVIAKQMIMNIQQFMPQEMWVEMSGDEFGEQPGSNLFTPDMITGEFNYQVSDGTLPFDKMAMVEVWKEILFGIMQDPQLRQEFSVSKIFEHVAVLGGAKNISAFKNQMQPGMQLPAPGQPPAGAVPMGAAIPQLPSQ